MRDSSCEDHGADADCYTLFHAIWLFKVLSVCRYPHSLFFLDCLQSHDFRTALARNEVKV